MKMYTRSDVYSDGASAVLNIQDDEGGQVRLPLNVIELRSLIHHLNAVADFLDSGIRPPGESW